MRNYVLAATERLTPNTVLLSLRPKRHKDRLQFSPGQYAAVGFKRHGRPSPMRCFSIVSSPNKPDELQFAMRVYGDFTRAIAQLEPGTAMCVRGPFGNFVVDEQYDRNLVLLAGGIGITPFMSIIRLHTERQSSKPMTLLYSCSSQNNIPFYDELRSLERRNPRFKAVFFVTRGAVDELAGARALTGRIGAAHLERLTSGKYNACTYFLCGPKEFIGGLRDTLLVNGTEPARIVTEEFTPVSKANTVNAQLGWSVRRWTYGLSSAAMMAATAFIMTLDLARTVPRLASNVSKVSTTQAPAPSTTTTLTAGSSSASSASSSSAATPAPSTATKVSKKSSPPAQQTPSPSPPSQNTYQPPVTSVS